MRLRIPLVAISLLVAACGTSTAGSAGEVPTLAAAHTSTRTHETRALASGQSSQSRPVWQGFDTAMKATEGLTAVVHGPTEVFESPTSADPWTTLEPATILGTTTVLPVIGGPERGRYEVMLPLRPNGSTGWIEGRGLDFYIADAEIRVDLSDRELTYVVDGTEVLRTKVGVGSEHNQTPTGVYFVTDSVTLSDPGSPWGPYALGLSARSDSITEFNGGDGIIGIHGTNNPGSIGDDISLGCIRLRNEDIAALHEMTPIGTRVTIGA